MDTLKGLERGTIIGILVLILLLFLGILQVGQGLVKGFSGLIPSTTQPEAIPGSVVLQIQNATDLTTAIYHAETPVPAQQVFEVLGKEVGSTKILYLAVGEVRAGIDLSEITANSINMKSGKIHVTLPAPTVIDRKLDIESSTIYDITKTTFGPNNKEALLQEAERQSLRAMVKAACSHGILNDANNQAKSIVKQILSTAGYQDIQIDVEKPAENACLA